MDNQHDNTMKKLEDLTTIQKAMVLGILLLTFAVLLIPFLSDDIYFKKTIVTYDDGCSETYIDGKLITPECPKPDPYNKWFPDAPNFTLNLT